MQHIEKRPIAKNQTSVLNRAIRQRQHRDQARSKMRMNLRTEECRRRACPYVLKKHFAHSKKNHAERSLSLRSNGGRWLCTLNTWSNITQATKVARVAPAEMDPPGPS